MYKYQISSNEAQCEFTKAALRSALVCLAMVKMFSVSCYVLLYFLIVLYTPGEQHWSTVMRILIVVVIIFTVLLAFLLLAVAWRDSKRIITAAIGVAVILALVDLFLGAFAGAYFIRFGHTYIHFLLAGTFVCLALSYIPVIGNDWYLIYSYKKFLNFDCC